MRYDKLHAPPPPLSYLLGIPVPVFITKEARDVHLIYLEVSLLGRGGGVRGGVRGGGGDRH